MPESGGGETVVAEGAPTPEVAGSGGSSIGEPTVAEPVEVSQASAVAPQAASVSTGASGGAGVTADAPIGAPSALKEGSLADVVPIGEEGARGKVGRMIDRWARRSRGFIIPRHRYINIYRRIRRLCRRRL